MGVPAMDTVRRTAEEGWIYGYPMLLNYRTLRAHLTDPGDPGYVGGFGRFRHTPPRSAAVAGDEIVRSWAWLDLRAEPWTISVPATDRYYVLPPHDLDTCYVGFIGARTTGQGPGTYLLAGPGWTGPVPDGIDGVLRAQTFLVGILARTWLGGPDDVPGACRVQAGYRLVPLSAHPGAHPGEIGGPPAPSEWARWPRWDERALRGADAFRLLDFLLGFFPALPEEAELRSRLAELGIDGTGEFRPESLTAEIRAAVEMGVVDARLRLRAAVERVESPERWYGTRERLGDEYLGRAVAAHLGLYGLPRDEIWYGRLDAAAEGTGSTPEPDAGMRDYVVRFPPGELPPTRFGWTAAVYRLPEWRPAGNGAERRAVGDRTPGLLRDADGGLTLRVQHKRPEAPDAAANWLPAPAGPFAVVLRIYGPDPAVPDGRWRMPRITPRG